MSFSIYVYYICILFIYIQQISQMSCKYLKCLLLLCGLSFQYYYKVFQWTEVLNFIELQLIILFLWLLLIVSYFGIFAAAAAKSLQSCLTLCDPKEGSPPGSPVSGILQARILEWVAISFSNAYSEKSKWSRSVVSDSSRPHRLQPTRLLSPWGFPCKSTGVGCHCLLLGICTRSHKETFTSCLLEALLSYPSYLGLWWIWIIFFPSFLILHHK